MYSRKSAAPRRRGRARTQQAAETSGPLVQANSNEVTMPKLPPPPRSPQNRSAFDSGLAVTSAVGGDDVGREQVVERQPVLALSQPLPPPSVSPAMPVVETARRSWPARGLRLARRSRPRSRRPRRAPCGPRDRRSSRASATGRSPGRRRRSRSRCRVAAAADRERQRRLAREVDRRDHVGRRGAARNQRGAAVDHAVPHHAHLVVAEHSLTRTRESDHSAALQARGPGGRR